MSFVWNLNTAPVVYMWELLGPIVSEETRKTVKKERRSFLTFGKPKKRQWLETWGNQGLNDWRLEISKNFVKILRISRPHKPLQFSLWFCEEEGKGRGQGKMLKRWLIPLATSSCSDASRHRFTYTRENSNYGFFNFKINLLLFESTNLIWAFLHSS